MTWRGVFPAATTQFKPDLAIDFDTTQNHLETLIRGGAGGIVVLGTLGENNSLTHEEKRRLLTAAVEVSQGRVPVITGVSELTTDQAISFAQDAEGLRVDGLMILPAMVYVPDENELITHLRSVAGATSLPVMIYNNPPAYRVDIGLRAIERLLDLSNILYLKESSGDTRRFTDLWNDFGSRLNVFAGLDDVALEAILLGASGWVSGLANAFLGQSLELWAAAETRDLERAREIYRWFMPLLHLDSSHDLVQTIKLVQQAVGSGSERVRPPRYALDGARRAEVLALAERAGAGLHSHAVRR